MASLTRYSRRIGPECRPAVAAPREGRGTRTFPLQVATPAMRIDDFTDQQCPAVAELRHERAELMPGIRHRQRQCTGRDVVAGTDGGELRITQRIP